MHDQLRFAVLAQYEGRRWNCRASRLYVDLAEAYREAIRLRRDTGATFSWVEAVDLDHQKRTATDGR